MCLDYDNVSLFADGIENNGVVSWKKRAVRQK
jgi:hypothetical protein